MGDEKVEMSYWALFRSLNFVRAVVPVIWVPSCAVLVPIILAAGWPPSQWL